MNWKVLDNDVGQGLPYVPRKKPWIGAAIGAVGSILGSTLTNSANASMDEETRDWQEYMWKQNNAYNHPYQQRHRLEQAGINPALAFQNGNTGVASSEPTANQHTPADWSALGSGMNVAVQNYLAAQRLGVESKNIEADTEIKNQQAMTTYSEAMARIQKTLADENLSKANRYFLEWQLGSMKQLFPLVQQNQYAQLESTLAQTEFTKQLKIAKAVEIDLAQKRYFLDQKLNDAQIGAIAQQIAESAARIRQNDRSLDINERAVSNDVIHSMNMDAAAFENIGISKEMINSEKFRNYVGSAVGAVTGLLGAAGAFGIKGLFQNIKPVTGFRSY